jgi:2-C-methyl-D-erythritol 4-phosphate cytidylyltransferase/2-C-methyl-D-erythritol 2,4-cyclodiphosphate synthase
MPKQLLELGGRPMLAWSVGTFLECSLVSDLIVVVPPELADSPPACLTVPRLRLVVGGERRQDSVANGFDAVAPASEVIVVHDAARPFVDTPMIVRAIEAAAETGAAIAAVPSRDTIKQLGELDAAPGDAARRGRIVGCTLPRESIYLAQTPQAFRREVLRDAVALGRSGVEVTDEAALAERAGHRVRIVDGSARNIKITTPEDLAMAEALLGATQPAGDATPAVRVGCGYDLHRLIEGRPLVLGGIVIPFERGLAGHSDADVLCHAITDALLGAAAAGDIGVHFPDSDGQWRGASSIALLERAVQIARARGFRVVNVDATVIAERPSLKTFRAAIVDRLAAAVGLPADSVSVKAKTNEGVDATGRGDAIAAHAVVLVQRVAVKP